MVPTDAGYFPAKEILHPTGATSRTAVDLEKFFAPVGVLARFLAYRELESSRGILSKASLPHLWR